MKTFIDEQKLPIKLGAQNVSAHMELVHIQAKFVQNKSKSL